MNLNIRPTNGKRPVVVIGAGIAGLTAAWELKKKGLDVIVLEETSHIGGRICSVEQNNCTFESGMQFYYSAYREARHLLRETGMQQHLIPAPISGLMTWEGRIGTFEKTKPWLNLLGIKENLSLWAAIAKHAGALAALDIFNFKGDEALDRIDAAEYFKHKCGAKVLELAIRPMTTSYAFVEPEGHSLAMLLKIIKLGAIAKIYAHTQGNDALAKAMSKQLAVIQGRATGVTVRHGQVESVAYRANGREETVETNHVVCAVPPPQAVSLFSSQPELQGAFGRIPYSATIMAHFFLDRAIEGKHWVYVLSRHDGHKAAFAIDCRRRCPPLFPDGKSVIQVSFVNPTATALMAVDDETILKQALNDMKVYLPDLESMIKRTSVIRRPLAVPTYHAGMFGNIRDLETQAARIQGLRLAGDYLRAPLIEGAIRSAKAAAGADQ
ncbi:MAG: FAD-dependent oxidoreductase [Elusimicrobia bacterium]|nr:FAD-dependent oxidoreductase [Elusimicrobiota bacterium]